MFRVISWRSRGGHDAVLPAESVQPMTTVPQPIRTWIWSPLPLLWSAVFSCVQVRADSPIAFPNVFEAVVMIIGISDAQSALI
jgi:hypothetical protein